MSPAGGSYPITMVCAAISKMMKERCVAGLEYGEDGPGAWIRPVGSSETGALTYYDMMYEDGTRPRVLDIVQIWMKHPCPDGCQQENHLIDDTSCWAKLGTVSPVWLLKACDNSAPLWVDGCGTSHGMNDRVPALHASGLCSSLRLVEQEGLTLHSQIEPFGPKVRAEFDLEEGHYKLCVTDAVWEPRYLAKALTTYKVRGRYMMCISLGKEFNGFRYKLVASIVGAV
jgi:hypothetical protein